MKNIEVKTVSVEEGLEKLRELNLRIETLAKAEMLAIKADMDAVPFDRHAIAEWESPKMAHIVRFRLHEIMNLVDEEKILCLA